MKSQAGRLINNSVKLMSHEEETVSFLLNMGCDIELIVPSKTKGTKSPDMRMNGTTWEMKAPRVGKTESIKHIYKKALKQSSNVIFDFRHLSTDKVAVKIIKQTFETYKKAKKVIIITKTLQILDIRK